MQQTSSVADFSPVPSAESALPTLPPTSLVWAYRLFWLTFTIFFAATGAGKLWDRYWHATRRFDTFWSPPHIFVLVMTMICGFIVAAIAFTPKLNAWFGPSIRVPFIRKKFAGPLVILGSGLIALTITLMLDSLWHTAFGLDETQWSFPHGTLAQSWFIIIMGFVAGRMAFRVYRPINWLTKLLMALFILVFMCPPSLGPFYLNYSPHLLLAFKSLPILRAQPSAQHMYRIYLNFGLTRQTSPIFIPEVAMFAGCAMAFLQRLDRRIRIFILAPLAWSFALMGRDLYTIYFLHYGGVTRVTQILPVALKEPSLWVPIPLFVAVVLFTLLQRTSLSERHAYAFCGFIFGLCTFAIWHTSPWMALLAIPASFTILLGAWIGKHLYQLVEKPSIEVLLKYLMLACAQIPALLGIIDLILRRMTP